jgi:hypothetical protein
MTEAILEQREATLSLLLPDVAAAAERVLTLALESCASRMGLEDAQAAARHVRQGNVVACVHCCSSIAKQVAESLGASEQNIRAIYAPDYDVLFEDLCSDKSAGDKSTVRLLVWTRRQTSSLDSLVTAWDRALAEACREKIGPYGQAPSLEVQVLEDTDVAKHFGSRWHEGMTTRLAVYWMWTMNQVVDIVYDRRDV